MKGEQMGEVNLPDPTTVTTLLPSAEYFRYASTVNRLTFRVKKPLALAIATCVSNRQTFSFRWFPAISFRDGIKSPRMLLVSQRRESQSGIRSWVFDLFGAQGVLSWFRQRANVFGVGIPRDPQCLVCGFLETAVHIPKVGARGYRVRKSQFHQGLLLSMLLKRTLYHVTVPFGVLGFACVCFRFLHDGSFRLRGRVERSPLS
jgi:hypothetical protein